MAYGAVDPNILQAMMNYQVAPSPPSTNKDWQKAQGSYLTNLSKGANAVTDLDTQISLGGLSPGAFAPMTTLDPVDAPGARQLAQWRQGSPYQKFIAAGFDAGKSANQIFTELQKVVADPSDPTAQSIRAELPRMTPYYDDRGHLVQPDPGPDGLPLPDMRLAGDEIRGFESNIQGDPEFQMVNGQPMSATTKDSPARQALLDAGIVSDPQAGYDPYMFAPSGVTPESDAKIADTLKRWGPVNEARDTLYQTAATDAAAADEAYRKFLTPRSPEDIAARVTLVAQDAHIFDGTIRDNLLLADPAAGQPELRDALAAAALLETVAGFFAGLDTPVGPGGEALSGGQRRRLSVAQGVLRRPAVLLLDEPIDALDSDTAGDLLAGVRAAVPEAVLVLALHDRQVPNLPWIPTHQIELHRSFS